jgi:hypothetical protein
MKESRSQFTVLIGDIVDGKFEVKEGMGKGERRGESRRRK